MKRPCLMGLVIFFLSFTALAETFKVPDIPKRESASYRVYYKDFEISELNERSLNEQILIGEAPREFEGTFYWLGDGQTRHLEYAREEILQNGTLASYHFVFKPGPELILEYFEKTVTMPGNKQLRYEKYDTSHPVFKLPRGTLHPYIIEAGFRGMPLEPGYKKDFYIWLAPKSIMRMQVKVEGIEDVKTKAGTFKCYRLEMSPNLDDYVGSFAGRIIKVIIPDYTFWMDSEEPHTLIKYSGPLGEVNALGAPIEVREVVSVSKGHD